jgi:hypothetical protein
MEILAIAKLAHLVGLVMGLGGAMLADYTTLTRGVLRPVSVYTIHQMHFLSRIVAVGLGLLWISGIAIIWLNTQANPDYVTNQKLWAKVIVVAVLTLNGFYIHKTILPSLQKSLGRRLFDGVAHREVAFMTLCGSFSFVSWTVPLVLAKATTLNYVTPVQNILTVYAALLLLVWFGMFALMSSIVRAQAYARTVAANNPGNRFNRRLFDNVSNRDLGIITLLASFLAFSWVLVFVLAKAPDFGYVLTLPNLVALYASCVLAVGLLMFTLVRGLSRAHAYARHLARKALAMTLLPNASWEMHPHPVQIV